MANYAGFTSSNTPDLTNSGKGYRTRGARTGNVGPDVLASLCAKVYRSRMGRTTQRMGPNVVVNRVWDTSANKYVTWESTLPDPLGAYYPGPGVYASQTTGWCVIDTVAR